jgi:hypothetical protein
MNEFRSVRRFIFTEDGRLRIRVYVLTVTSLFVLIIAYQFMHKYDSQAASNTSSDAENDKQLIELRTEYAVASGNDIYLVLDFARNRLVLKQHGAVVWEAPFQIDSSDTAQITDFIASFTSDSRIQVRPLERAHLFRSNPVVSDRS